MVVVISVRFRVVSRHVKAETPASSGMRRLVSVRFTQGICLGWAEWIQSPVK